MQRILVCDDDKQIVDAIDIYLSGEGFEVVKAYDGYEALEILDKQHIDLMIIDVMMPGLDGIRTTRKVRETSSIPIIILSAKSEDTDKILGLNIGADDYLSKPFNPLELVARVKSQIRRYVNFGSLSITKSQLVNGGLVLDTDAKALFVDGEPVKVTPIEYKIMEFLMKNMGRVLSSSQIYEAVWNEPSFTSEKTVTVHIRNIREKIEINPKEPKYIKVVYGLGYKCEKI